PAGIGARRRSVTRFRRTKCRRYCGCKANTSAVRMVSVIRQESAGRGQKSNADCRALSTDGWAEKELIPTAHHVAEVARLPVFCAAARSEVRRLPLQGALLNYLEV